MGLSRAFHVGTLSGTIIAVGIVALLLSSSVGTQNVAGATGIRHEFFGKGGDVTINFTRTGGEENTDYSIKLPKESNVLSASVNLTGDYAFKSGQLQSLKGPADWKVGTISKEQPGDIPTLTQDSDGMHLDMDTLSPFWPGDKKAVGTNPYDIVVGDFNKDGRDDFATANYDSDSVTVYYQDAQGKFSSKSTVTTSDAPKSIDKGDFNGDGRMDLVVGCDGGQCVDFLTQKSTGGFDRTTTSIGRSVIGVATGDLNGDGLDDVAVATNSFYGYTLIQDDTGGFSSTSYTVGDYLWGSSYYSEPIRDVACADFNRDGYDDVVWTICWFYGYNYDYYQYGSTKVYTSSSSGALSNTEHLYTGTGSWYVEAGDVTGDGRPDIVVTRLWTNKVTAIYQTASGGWASPTGLTGTNEPRRMAIADFDGDGKKDLCVATDKPAMLFFKQEDGQLNTQSKAFDLPAGSDGRAVGAGFLDLDGYIDAVTADGSGNTASIFKQRLTYDGSWVSNAIEKSLPIRFINFTWYMRPGGGTEAFYFSVDGGLNWTQIVNGTVYDLVNRTKTIWLKLTMHAPTSSKYDGLREWRLNMTYQSYPADLVVDFGSDGKPEWNISGELIGRTTVANLAAPLTAYVQNTTHQADGAGNVTLPIKIYSTQPGSLRVNGLDILFNNASRPPSLISPPDNGWVNATPTFTFYSNDTDNDMLLYKVQITKTDFDDPVSIVTFDMNKDLFQEHEGEGFLAATFPQGTVAGFTLPESFKLDDGAVYRWRVYAFDGYLWSRASRIFTMKVDSITPIGHASSPKFSTSLDFNVTWTAEDVMPGSGLAPEGTYDVQYRKSSETAWTDWLARSTQTFALFHGQEGMSYYFRMRARDAVMNEQLFIGGKGDTQTSVDTIAPTIAWAQMPNFQDTRSFLVRWIANDFVPGSGIKYFEVQVRKESGDWTSWLSEFRSSQSVYQADADTVYSFQCRALDNAGNLGPWSEVFTIRIDATPPVLMLAPRVPLEGGVWGQLDRLMVNFSYIDLESGVRNVEIGIGTDKNLFDVLAPTTLEYPAGGQLELTGLQLVNSAGYYVGVHAENNAGAWTDWAWSDEFTVAIPGPKSMISFPSGVVTDPKELVHIAVTDPRGYNITLGDLRVRSATRVGDAWPWSDWERVSNARTDVWFEGKRGFRYQFMYRAQNELGSWGDFWTPRDDQWYYINNPPVANGGPAKISRAGKDVQFSADQSSDRDGDQLSWAWDFGDGGTATGLFVAHKYSKAGLYTVTLTVSDGHENSTARTTVYVEAQQKTPGFGSAVATLGIIAAAGISVAVAGGRRSRER